MKTIHVFYTIFFLCLLQACFKGNSEERFTISGNIYQSCTSVPLSNRELSFFQAAGSSLQPPSGGQLGTTVTDASGHFSFTYKPGNNSDLKIQLPAGFGYSDIVTGVPSKKNLENLTLRYGAVTTVQVRLNVLKPYANTDTLYITDFRDLTAFMKIAGPFTSGVLYSATNVGIGSDYSKNSKNLGFRIGSASSWQIKNFTLITCDTSRVTADIN